MEKKKHSMENKERKKIRMKTEIRLISEVN